MFLFIDETIVEKKLTFDEEFFFSDIASAYRRGCCHLSGNFESLRHLHKNLGEPAKGIYKLVMDQYAESKSIMEAINKIFVLTCAAPKNNAKQNLPAFLQRKGKVQLISIKKAIRWNWQIPCCLLAENLNDCNFYQLVAKVKSPKGIYINLHFEHGGGSTIANVLEKCVSQDRVPTLCIIDSDYKYGKTRQFPQIKKGDTLTKVKETEKKLSNSKCPPYKVFPLNVHEVENLIPLSVFFDLKNQYTNMENGVVMLTRLKKVWKGRPILYYDIKNGISSFTGNDPKSAYWKAVSKELNNQQTSCETGCPKQMEKIVSFPKLSSHGRLLCSANIIIKQQFENESLKIDRYLNSNWEKIGNLVIAWGCANPPQYA